MWQKADGRGLDWYKRNVHQDMAALFLSIHDEVDLVVDRFLLKAIMVELSKVAESKWIFDRFGFPYINFYFDNEFDQWGSFTATGGFNPYKYALDSLKQRMGLVSLEIVPAKDGVAVPSPEVQAKAKVALLKLPNRHDSLSEFEKTLNRVDSGDYFLDLVVDFGDGNPFKFRYDRRVDIEELSKIGAVETA